MKNFNMRYLLFLPILIGLIFGNSIGCSRKTSENSDLEFAERIMEAHPDSALTLLSGIDTATLHSEEERARYALLMSMAKDKNMIDLKSFDLLAPAIDYYLNNGTDDDKLRTYYYQGRIYQNRGDMEKALKSFVLGKELKNIKKDSLTLARLLVAQGTIYVDLYKLGPFIDNNLQAAEIYRSFNKTESRLWCYAKVLSGYLLKNDMRSADSIFNKCESLIDSHKEIDTEFFIPYYVSYKVWNGDKNKVREVLEEFGDDRIPDEALLDMANRFLELGDPRQALELLERIKDKPNEFLEDKYYIIHSAVYSSLGRYKEAYEMFRKYYANLDSIHSDIFDHDTLFVEKKHALEMAELKAEKRKEMTIWISVCSLLAAAALILFLYYRGRLMKSKRAVAEKENARLIMEQEALKTEKRNIELEKDKKELEAADLRREVAQLENERDYLEDSLQRSNDGHVALRAVAEKRLEMLNGLLASKITNNETYAGSYNEMIAKIKDDRNAFLESLRSMIKTNYPKFMDFLVGKGLNDKEISYICLYALGLSGKEIGEYINLKRHYAFSSAIRKKLNIDGDAGNLGPYIRRLMDE